MQTFYDSKNNKYDLAITFLGAKRVRAALNIDLLEPFAGNPLLGKDGGAPDVIAAIDVVFALIADQAEKKSLISEQYPRLDEAWAAAMGPEQMLAARAALYEEWELFFRSLGRPDAATAISKTLEMLQATVTQAARRFDQINVEAEVAKAFGAAPTSSPESSASTPTR